MRRPSEVDVFHVEESKNTTTPETAATWLFGGFWIVTLLGSIFSGGPWSGLHALLFLAIGLLMIFFSPAVRLPRLWWLLALLYLTTSFGAFLPADWFDIPSWRRDLETLGLSTGSLVTIQPRMAAETLTVFVVTFLTGFWFSGHRATPRQLRIWTLAFAGGVAIFAVLSKVLHASTDSAGSYGFFPNRNHTATFLSMGTICGLGSVLQASRDKRFMAMCFALCTTAVCLWALVGWSISRGGVVLVASGSLGWSALLGRRYLGENGMRAFGLIALATVGFFVIADSVVKQRLSQTIEKAIVVTKTSGNDAGDEKGDVHSRFVDLRVPIALDTFSMINDFKWTGVGAGQFKYVFPQYRYLSSVVNDSENVHPESDWLWMASETGIPSAATILGLVILAAAASLKSLRNGRDRALRCACLVAALLVPIHGFFDVPGHRISLALSAVFLLTLSLRSTQKDKPVSLPAGLSFRLAGGALVVLSIFLARAEWGKGREPVSISSFLALVKAHDLYLKDKEQQEIAAAAGTEYQPDSSEDPLEQALDLVANARINAPMDRDLLWYQAFFAFHYEDKYELIDQSFAIERALDPTWIGAPLRQAQAWIPVDPGKVRALWAEAMRRSEELERLQPDSPWSPERTLRRIHLMGTGYNSLEGWTP